MTFGSRARAFKEIPWQLLAAAFRLMTWDWMGIFLLFALGRRLSGSR